MHYRIIQDDARRLKDYIDEPIDLVVTSPPYWDIKDYGVDGQIGHGQEYDEYIKDLVHIFSACVDVIEPGGRICINVGEQYLSSSKYGRYRIQPIPHDLTVGLMQARNDIDYMGSIIWNKISNQNPSGGGKWMGSTYWPTEILFTFEHEYILIFRKHGKMPDAGDAILAASKLTKEERSEWSRGIWQIPAVRGSEHPAPFPKELATRLIKMYSYFAGTVLDPCLLYTSPSPRDLSTSRMPSSA